MIRTSYNDIIVKIFYNGKEIQKVYQKQIQVFPDTDFQKFFWLKVFDEDDQKTYYYNCTQTSVIYQEGSTEIIKEIHYTTGQKQENSPGENQQIYELINDQVNVSGQNYDENDFASFVDKSPNEVTAMTQTYQEKLKDLVNIKLGLARQDEIFTRDGAITFEQLQKNDIINNGKGFENLSEVPDDYLFCYSDYTSDKGYKLYQIIFKNVGGSEQDFYFITTGQFEGFTWCSVYVTDVVSNYNEYQTDSQTPTSDGKGWTVNIDKKRGILYNVKIPVNYYISIYITLRAKSAGETFYNTFCYKEKSFSVIDGNFLNHKYISDTIQEKAVGKFKYNFAYAMIKNDLNKKVYQTNCKYIISIEERPGLHVNSVLKIPKKSLGWNLLSGVEYKEYATKSSKYKIILTLAVIEGSYSYIWGVIQKNVDLNIKYNLLATDDNITWYYGNDNKYVPLNTKSIFTCVWNSYDKNWEVWQDGQKKSDWDYSNITEYVFKDTDEFHLNSYLYTSILPETSFYFYEFKIVNVDSGKIVKRFVPSDDKTKLWECVSGKYIEPCRNVDDSSLPVLVDNLKLGVETKDGLGNKIEDWFIINE